MLPEDWFRRPYAHVYLVSCADADEFRGGATVMRLTRCGLLDRLKHFLKKSWRPFNIS